MRKIKSKISLAFTILLIVSMISIQPAFAKKPVTANEYVIEFEAEGDGTFLVFSGFIGPNFEFDLVAAGEGNCIIDGEAVVTQGGGGMYYDFPAADMHMECVLTGEIRSAETDNGIIEISDEVWNIELKLQNKRKAGGTFAPEAGIVIIIEEIIEDGVDRLPSTCLQYELELEKENDEDYELNINNGKAYAVGAGDLFPGPSVIDEIIIILEFSGAPYTIIFIDEYDAIPELPSTTIDINVELEG